MDSCSMSYVLCKFMQRSGQLLNPREGGTWTCIPITETLRSIIAIIFFSKVQVYSLKEKKESWDKQSKDFHFSSFLSRPLQNY